MNNNFKSHILLVDDDKKIRDLLKKILEKNNFYLTVVEDAKNAKEEISKYIFNIIILDLLLPDTHGSELIKDIRESNIKTPIIMLTALNDIDSKTICFENGCNDYLAKPFEIKELILRINNLLEKNHNNLINCRFGDFIFDFDKQSLSKGDIKINLTDIELKMINILCKNTNKIVSRKDFLFDNLNERSIDVYITRIRKKIEKNSKKPIFLKTVRNKGYILYN